MKRSFGPRVRTMADREAATVADIYSPLRATLDGVTVDTLMRQHGASERFTEYHLTIARQKEAARKAGVTLA